MSARIRIQGCDGSTDFTIELSPEEIEAVKRVAAASVSASDYECEPTLHVEEVRA